MPFAELVSERLKINRKNCSEQPHSAAAIAAA